MVPPQYNLGKKDFLNASTSLSWLEVVADRVDGSCIRLKSVIWLLMTITDTSYIDAHPVSIYLLALIQCK